MMSFFGYQIAPGKKYKQTPPEGVILHLSQASLSKIAPSGEKNMLKVVVEETPFSLCILTGGSSEHTSLDLNFAAGQEVIFYMEGKTPIDITGYYQLVEFANSDSEDDEEMDEEELDSDFQPREEDSDEDMNNISGVISESELPRMKSPKKMSDLLNASFETDVNDEDFTDSEDGDDEEDRRLLEQMFAEEEAAMNRKKNKKAAKQAAAAAAASPAKASVTPTPTPSKQQTPKKVKQEAQPATPASAKRPRTESAPMTPASAKKIKTEAAATPASAKKNPATPGSSKKKNKFKQ